MEGGGGADGDGDASLMSSGQREQPTPASPSLPSDPPADTMTAVLHRTMESTRLILRELDQQGLRRAGQDLGLDDAYRNGRFGAVPASSEAIASLPQTTAAETKEKDCAVCLESYEQSDKLRRMPCSHGFHEDCILKWLRISRICPLCRFVLLPEAVAD